MSQSTRAWLVTNYDKTILVNPVNNSHDPKAGLPFVEPGTVIGVGMCAPCSEFPVSDRRFKLCTTPICQAREIRLDTVFLNCIVGAYF